MRKKTVLMTSAMNTCLLIEMSFLKSRKSWASVRRIRLYGGPWVPDDLWAPLSNGWQLCVVAKKGLRATFTYEQGPRDFMFYLLSLGDGLTC